MAEQANKHITMDLTKTISKIYAFIPSGSIKTSVPREPLEREARNLGLTLDEFLGRYNAEWHFGDSFPGMYLCYVAKGNHEDPDGKNAQ